MVINSTTKEYIKKARLVHGDKYDYSLVDYIASRLNIRIICPVHGEFLQRANSHLSGKGCCKCKNTTTEEFIAQANLIHRNKYDYSLVEYVNSKSKIKIICPEHGEFEQIPNSHLTKHGCHRCASPLRKEEDFINLCKIKHNNKYDYSLVEYRGNRVNIKIICPEHGVFEQIPDSHLRRGCECLKCSGKNKPSTEEFIAKAKLVHGDKYNYSLVKYIRSTSKIKIICPDHGIFEQKAVAHLNSTGCPKCKGHNKTTEEFIAQAKLIHEDKYDYSLVVYEKVMGKVEIICPKHGIFLQTANNHLGGAGCKSCYESKGEKAIKEFLENTSIKYIAQHSFDGCKHKNKLSFDFFLPNHNLLIEYDGEQHFKQIKYFGGKKRFQQSQINDNIKNEFAKHNNINLLRIKFDEFNNINNILTNTLQI